MCSLFPLLRHSFGPWHTASLRCIEGESVSQSAVSLSSQQSIISCVYVLFIYCRFPKTESLRDCMERTIPYFKNVIYPESISKGKSRLSVCLCLSTHHIIYI